MIDQSLYLEAEAVGLRGTGIGCFFDDGMHEMLGIKGKTLQAVYHFTLGVPINDPRLACRPTRNKQTVFHSPILSQLTSDYPLPRHTTMA